jgi:2-polyprenyl-3-methyl-5-hydroxy-6-metoxy-1,4-benzoquinol methylase
MGWSSADDTSCPVGAHRLVTSSNVTKTKLSCYDDCIRPPVGGGEAMAEHVCPWWGGYFIDNSLRRLLHNPEKLLGPHVEPGMTVMDVGCGMGFFSIAMARMVGENGTVIAVDFQQQMLDVLRRRAAKAGVVDRIRFHKCEQDSLGIDVQADFALAFMMVHEVPDPRRLLAEIYGCLNPGGKLLVAEPKIHVRGPAFRQTMAAAEDVGFRVAQEPPVRWCRAVVFGKT